MSGIRTIDCLLWKPTASKRGGRCTAGYYGGNPSHVICEKCCQHQQPNPLINKSIWRDLGAVPFAEVIGMPMEMISTSTSSESGYNPNYRESYILHPRPLVRWWLLAMLAVVIGVKLVITLAQI